MATFDAILVPASLRGSKEAALAASTSSTEIAVGHNVMLAINADQDVTVRFGPVGLGAADATDFRIPQNSTMVFDLGRDKESVRFFNLSSTTAANIWYLALSKF